MPNPVWPVQLPNFVLQSGYQEKLPDNVIESPAEGRSKTRRRFTAQVRQMNLSVQMDNTQAAIFETFYETTTKNGSLPFDWVHPRYRTAITFKFKRPPPTVTPVSGEVVTVQMAVETVPS